MFGRATIRLGIDPHSSYVYFCTVCSKKSEPLAIVMKEVQNISQRV